MFYETLLNLGFEKFAVASVVLNLVSLYDISFCYHWIPKKGHELLHFSIDLSFDTSF